MPCLVDKRTLDTLVGGWKIWKGCQKSFEAKIKNKTKTKTKNFQTPIGGQKVSNLQKGGQKSLNIHRFSFFSRSYAMDPC